MSLIVIGNIISGVIDFIANLVSAIDGGIKRIQDFIDKIQEAIDKANRIPVLGALIPDQFWLPILLLGELWIMSIYLIVSGP